MTSADIKHQNLSLEVTNIKSQWENFIHGKSVDKDIVNPLVLSSWKRSKIAGVDPHNAFALIPNKDAERHKLDHDDLLQAFGSVIPIIEEIIIKNNLKIQLFDSKAQSVHLAMFAEGNTSRYCKEVESNILGNLSERVLGTNAVCLALREEHPVRIIGSEHYNCHLHDFFCCAAPLHDSKGEIVGALNLFSHLDNYFMGALSLVTCLASIFDNRTLIQTALEELDIYELAVNNIMEKSSKGVIYVNRDNQIKFYNSSLLKLLSVRQEDTDKNVINDFLSTSGCLSGVSTFENREVIFPEKGRKKSLLVSTRNLFNAKNELKGKIVFVEDTDSVYKSFQRIRGNKAHYTFNDIVGENKELLAAKNLAIKVAQTRAPILIHGESGTGKEVFAQAIHNKSHRNSYPFVSINCGAIPPELIESELFGYEAGAFTGALKGGKPGKLELASGGTLFLDEIESMPLSAQIKLLRALSTQKISRIGSIEEIPIDVRIISATKTDLLKDADEGCFREDLYYRISTIGIKLPPLRERIDDIPLLTDHLLKLHAKESAFESYTVHPDFMQALTTLHWRGNIRELSNVLERAVALSDNNNVLTTNLLPEHAQKKPLDGPDNIAHKFEKDLKKELVSTECTNLLKTSEEIAIKLAMEMDDGNVAKAAKRLGVSKPTLYSKIRKNENHQVVKP
jgi:transcriptional regulator with PAS, ATPase and Fis domain